MNILLWVLQVALAFLCISGGIFQIFKLDDLKKGVTAMRALPRAVWTSLGAFGCLGGVFLILPGAANVLPGLTWLAAAAVAAQSAVICALYVRYRDRSPLPYSAVMVLLAAFICYGRLALQPL
jgi:DoxX-like family